MTTKQKIIRAKVGLLELAKQLGNVNQAGASSGVATTHRSPLGPQQAFLLLNVQQRNVLQVKG